MTIRRKKQRPARFLTLGEIFSGKRDDIPSDVLGSYTGAPKDGGKPEQDADDL